LAIDPKPYLGDRTYDPCQHLLNCPDRLHAEPLRFLRGFAARLDLDAARLAQWLFARCVIECAEWPTLAEVARTLARSGAV
jgi:streptomycin 6-kinase